MKNFIINSFFLRDKNTLNDIYNYIKLRYKNTVEINDIKPYLIILIKKNILFLNDKNYELSQEGNIILDDHKYYYSKMIVGFLKKYRYKYIYNKLDKTKYSLKEVREEQQMLREYLINNKKHICIICDKNLPLCLLETAHLKPRCLLHYIEKNDNNVVEFMCRFCHKLYDDGYLGIYNGLLCVSQVITKNKYDLQYNENKQIIYYNIKNNKYFDYHYRNIYRSKL
jgi:hypothetical protein